MKQEIQNIIKVHPPKLKKGQKCWGCKEIIKKEFCWQGHFWHEKCLEKISIVRYLKNLE